MNTLYLLCGIPGSGKSTWIQGHINPNTDKWVSRDEIRFSHLKEGEDYFSHETQVFKEFVSQINENLKQGFNVFADATHLTPFSRNKILTKIKVRHINIECIWVRTSLKEAIRRNENRVGTRSYVPEATIRNMHKSFIKPTFKEGFSTIYIVETHKPITIQKEEIVNERTPNMANIG